MRVVPAIRFSLCALFCAVFASANAETVDLAKKYPAGDAKIVKTKDGSGQRLLYSGNGKTPHIVRKAKVTQAANKTVVKKKNSKTADKLNPKLAGAKKLSMQDYNRYAYRKSNSGKSGVPVTKAASGELGNDVKQ